MKKNIVTSIILIIVIGLVVYWNLPKEDQEVSSELTLSINDQAINLIKEEKYRDSYFMLFDDLNIDYNLDNINKENLSPEKRKEYNLFLYSSAKDAEVEIKAYIPALQDYKKLEPIDGIVTQDEINEAIADLTPKAEIAKKEFEAEKNIIVKPSIGMTKDEVRNSTWGKPKYTNKTTTANGVHEQWVYSGNRYLYFDNGILTTIQD